VGGFWHAWRRIQDRRHSISRYLGLNNDAQVANGMVTGCLENMSIWTQVDMHTVDQSTKERWYSGERDPPRMVGCHRIGRRGTKQKGSRENGLRVRPESRIPPAKDVLPVTIEHACANLQQQVGAPMAPVHLLFFHHAPAHHLVHRRFYKPRADPLAVTVAFTINWLRVSQTVLTSCST
jgi:hypothetical protein